MILSRDAQRFARGQFGASRLTLETDAVQGHPIEASILVFKEETVGENVEFDVSSTL